MKDSPKLSDQILSASETMQLKQAEAQVKVGAKMPSKDLAWQIYVDSRLRAFASSR